MITIKDEKKAIVLSKLAEFIFLKSIRDLTTRNDFALDTKGQDAFSRIFTDIKADNKFNDNNSFFRAMFLAYLKLSNTEVNSMEAIEAITNNILKPIYNSFAETINPKLHDKDKIQTFDVANLNIKYLNNYLAKSLAKKQHGSKVESLNAQQIQELINGEKTIDQLVQKPVQEAAQEPKQAKKPIQKIKKEDLYKLFKIDENKEAEDEDVLEVKESIDSFIENLEEKEKKIFERGKGEQLMQDIFKMKDDKKQENTELLKKIYKRKFTLNIDDLPGYLTEVPGNFYALLDQQKPREQKLQVDPNNTGLLKLA